MEITAHQYKQLVVQSITDRIDELVVGAFLFRADNKVLLLKRREDDFFGGFFELPSGNVEREEHLADALIREIDEETGLRISNRQILAYVDRMDYRSQTRGLMKRQLNFAVELSTKDPIVRLSSDHNEFCWIGIDSITNFDDVLNASLKSFFEWHHAYCRQNRPRARG